MKADEGYICMRWETDEAFRVTTENRYLLIGTVVPGNATGRTGKPGRALLEPFLRDKVPAHPVAALHAAKS